MPQFEFGLQCFGETGKWDHWASANEQLHRVGPAIFGKIPVGNHQAIKYNLAWLIGSTDATPDHTLRTQIEYEF